VALLRRLVLDVRAQDTIEYALMAALIGVVSIGALNLIEGTLGTTFSGWGTRVNGLSCMPSPGSSTCP
jgi:Flp pilus assembly pilin Flp